MNTKTTATFVAPETWMTKGFLAGWCVAWLRTAAADARIDNTGTKQVLVARIASEISKGNRRVIARFNRCS